MEGGPELRPGEFGRAAKEDVAALGGLFVGDAVGVGVLGDKAAGGQVGFDEFAGEADDDEGLRRGIAVAACPGGVNAADGRGQAVGRAIEIDGADFAVIFDKDAEMGAGFSGKRIADMGEGGDEVGPADFVAEGDVHLFGEMKPCGADGGER